MIEIENLLLNIAKPLLVIIPGGVISLVCFFGTIAFMDRRSQRKAAMKRLNELEKGPQATKFLREICQPFLTPGEVPENLEHLLQIHFDCQTLMVYEWVNIPSRCLEMHLFDIKIDLDQKKFSVSRGWFSNMGKLNRDLNELPAFLKTKFGNTPVYYYPSTDIDRSDEIGELRTRFA
jgi:hypothetical protein